MLRRAFTCVVLAGATAVFLGTGTARAQLSDTTTFLAHVSNEYRVIPNVTYHEANNHENQLDLYLPSRAGGPTPVLVFFHGGGWIVGNKESNVLRVLPYLEMGWAVVNVGYRLVQVSPAPAAVEDGLCALRWVARSRAVQPGPRADRDLGELGWGPPGVDDRHDPVGRRPGPGMRPGRVRGPRGR